MPGTIGHRASTESIGTKRKCSLQPRFPKYKFYYRFSLPPPNMRWICRFCVIVKVFMHRWKLPWNDKRSERLAVCLVCRRGNICDCMGEGVENYFLCSLRSFLFLAMFIWMCCLAVTNKLISAIFWAVLSSRKNSPIHMQWLPSIIKFKKVMVRFALARI